MASFLKVYLCKNHHKRRRQEGQQISFLRIKKTRAWKLPWSLLNYGIMREPLKPNPQTSPSNRTLKLAPQKDCPSKTLITQTLIVGIDVGSDTHFARAFDWRNYEYTKKPLEFSNTEAGFQMFKAWVEDIAEKQGKTAVIPGMEPTGHYWFALGKFLQDSGMKPVHVNPHHVKKSKELDDNNPNKNDRKDPKTIAALVNEGRFSYPYIPTGIYAEIRSLSNLRFQTQEELTRIKNRIARWFAIYFPEYKDVYGDLMAVSGRMILKEAPLPEDIRMLGVNGVN